MTKPVRLQLSRRKGFSLQALSLATNGLPAVNVARPSIFGNVCACSYPYGCPYDARFEREVWEEDDGSIDPLRCCVDVYRHYVETGIRGEPTHTGRLRYALEGCAGYPTRAKLVARLPSLRGKNLACWCALNWRPCHADVLLELANSPHAGGRKVAKIYITKYVGKIKECEFKELSISNDRYVYVHGEDWTSYKLDKDAFYERNEAIGEAKKRLAKKIGSLKKQIAKLEAIRFE